MKKMKLFVIMACILALLLSTAVPAFAAGVDELEGFAYTLDDEKGTILLTEYTGSQPNVTVEGSYTVDGHEYATLIDNVHLFRYNTTITSVTIKDGARPSGTSLAGLFYQCENLKTADVKGLDTTGVRSFNHLFSYCQKLQTIDVTGWNTSSVLNMSLVFNYCSALTTITGYEDWDTSSAWTIKFLFNRTSSIQKVDLSRWDLSHITNSGWCFQMCGAKEILLPDNLSMMSAGFLNHPTKYAASSLTIPAGVKKIGYAHTIYDFGTNAFNEIKVAEGNEYYKAVDGILYSMDGSELLAVPRGKTFENNVYEIPNDVTFMGEL
ncbi:MAG: BspA family leucine-rich repeat surface protein, partial [Clostridia bacterium]|nr:BspA family leucine-rich repeat surface protein [Clostridia bacterium]